MPVEMAPGPEVDLMVDPDQIEQMLINLVRNAVEAVREPVNPAEIPAARAWPPGRQAASPKSSCAGSWRKKIGSHH